MKLAKLFCCVGTVCTATKTRRLACLKQARATSRLQYTLVFCLQYSTKSQLLTQTSLWILFALSSFRLTSINQQAAYHLLRTVVHDCATPHFAAPQSTIPVPLQVPVQSSRPFDLSIRSLPLHPLTPSLLSPSQTNPSQPLHRRPRQSTHRRRGLISDSLAENAGTQYTSRQETLESKEGRRPTTGAISTREGRSSNERWRTCGGYTQRSRLLT